MAEKKIGEIKEELKAVDDEKLPSFIETYEKDERSGVVKIVEQAKKRFEKLEAEKLRIENLKKYEREYADYGYICGIDEVGSKIQNTSELNGCRPCYIKCTMLMYKHKFSFCYVCFNRFTKQIIIDVFANCP